MGKKITDRKKFRAEIARRHSIVTSEINMSDPGGFLKIHKSASGGDLAFDNYFSDFHFPDAPKVYKGMIDPESETFKNFKKVKIETTLDEPTAIILFGFKSIEFPKITLIKWDGIKFTFSQAKITDTSVFGESIVTQISFSKYSVELDW